MKKSILILALILSVAGITATTNLSTAYAKEDITSAAYLSKLAKETEKKLNVPVMVDENTQLVSIDGFDHEFQYNYVLVNYSSKDLDSAQFAKVMKEQLQETVCKNKALEVFLDKNIALSFTYKGTDKKLVGKVSITKDMCE